MGFAMDRPMHLTRLLLILFIGCLTGQVQAKPTEITRLSVLIATVQEEVRDWSEIYYANMFLNGLDLGLAEISDELKKNNIELDVQKIKLSEDINGAEKLKQAIEKNNIHIVIGPIYSADAVLAAQKINDLKDIPLVIIPSAKTTDLKKYDQFIIQLAGFNSQLTEALVSTIEKSSKSQAANLAIISAADCVYSQNLTSNFKEKIGTLKNIEVTEFKLLNEDTEFSALISQMNKVSWDYVLLPNYELLNVRLIKALQKSDVQIRQFLGSGSWGDTTDSLNGQLEEKLFRAQVVSSWQSNVKITDKSEDFKRKFQSKYNSVPVDVAAMAYDATSALKTLLIQNKKEIAQSKSDLKSTLKSIAKRNWKFSGLFKNVQLTNGIVDNAQLLLCRHRIEPGRPKPLYTCEVL